MEALRFEARRSFWDVIENALGGPAEDRGDEPVRLLGLDAVGEGRPRGEGTNRDDDGPPVCMASNSRGKVALSTLIRC